MRFFTMAWWCGVQEGRIGDPFPNYCAHIARIRAGLSVDRSPTLDALESLGVHDARLRELRFDPVRGTLRIRLDSYREGKHFTLNYAGVKEFVSESDPEVGLCGSSGYGDLGYCEIDIASDEVFVHRLLFSSGIELAVEFERFEFQHEGSIEPTS